MSLVLLVSRLVVRLLYGASASTWLEIASSKKTWLVNVSSKFEPEYVRTRT